MVPSADMPPVPFQHAGRLWDGRHLRAIGADVREFPYDDEARL